MCGRYVVNFDHDIYLAEVPLGEEIRSFNVAPTHTVPIIVDRLMTAELLAAVPAQQVGARVLHDGKGNTFLRELHSARWGLLPSWAKDASFSARAFNARSETVMSKPTFRTAALRGHCLIPMSGYYEWKTSRTVAGKISKTPYFIHRENGEPIYCAGLYEWWKISEEEAHKPNSRFAGQAGQWLLSCSILTMASPDELDAAEAGENDVQAHALVDLGNLHDRLPIPVRGETLTTWLRAGKVSGLNGDYALDGETVQASARSALAQVIENAYAEASHWRMYAVTAAVGSVASNSPDLIEPVEDLLTGL